MNEITPVGDSEIEPLNPVNSPHLEHVHLKTKTDVDTIQASEIAASSLVQLMSFPTLIPPTQKNNHVEALGSLLTSMSEQKKRDILFSLVSQMGEITSNLNDIFMKSLEAYIEETRRILNSYAHKDQVEFKRKSLLPADGVEENINAQATNSQSEILKDNKMGLQNIERISQEIKQMEKIDIPFTVLFTVAGSLALGTVNGQSGIDEANKDIIKLVHHIQAVVPQVKAEEIIPVINLMVMAPIIFRPLDESQLSQKQKAPVDFAKLVQDFAKDVIKMVTDPKFALLNIVNNIERIEHLTPEQKQIFIATLKLILLSVALSLMYSSEVGKIHGDKFLGMQPLEFKALLNPDNPLIKQKPEKSMNVHEKLVYVLITQIRIQMMELPRINREEILSAMLNFLEESKNIGKLLDPSKVLTNVLQSMNYKLPLSSSISV